MEFDFCPVLPLIKEKTFELYFNHNLLLLQNICSLKYLGSTVYMSMSKSTLSISTIVKLKINISTIINPFAHFNS